MKYIASVRDKETKKLMIIEREYSNKKEFEIDLRLNGFSVRFISTENNFDDDCAKWHEKNERAKRNSKIKTLVHRECAFKMGMTIREYNALFNR